MRTIAVLVAAAFILLAAGAAVLFSGLYDVSATTGHLAPTHWLLEKGMRRSVARHAAAIEVPPLDDPALKRRGAALALRHCVQCHGAPGIAPSGFALGLVPLPGNLAYTVRDWKPAEVYWVVRNGIKMAGMPAWEFRLPDRDLWAIVAHLQEWPRLSPAQYAARIAGVAGAPPPGDPGGVATSIEAPDFARGGRAIEQYACATCHAIPGIVGAQAPVGPPLDRYARRALVAGMLPNTPENLVRWLRAPQTLNPRTAMPDLGLSERDARDIAAYLGTLD